jgi:hypothetical protein
MMLECSEREALVRPRDETSGEVEHLKMQRRGLDLNAKSGHGGVAPRTAGRGTVPEPCADELPEPRWLSR